VLNDDYELSREDIQDLSSRDALAAFFAKLGYDTNDLLVQDVAAMDFTSDNHTNPRPGVRIVALASCGKTCPLSGSVHRAR